MEYLDKIEDYINQTLSNEERISFEKECATNSKLAEELALIQVPECSRDVVITLGND